MSEVKSKGAWWVKSIDDIRRDLVPCLDQPTVHISRSCVCDRMALRGVPAMAVDVLIDRRITDHTSDDLPLLVTRSAKAGKYDYQVRDRWLARRIPEHTLRSQQVAKAELLVTRQADSIGLRIITDVCAVVRADYRRLPPIDDDYDQWACVRRNWTRYFRHLHWSEVEAADGEFVPMPVRDDDTISELNQWCCHWLTELSYSLGWARVIAPAAARRGLPLWHRDGAPAGDAVAPLEAIQDRLEATR